MFNRTLALIGIIGLSFGATCMLSTAADAIEINTPHVVVTPPHVNVPKVSGPRVNIPQGHLGSANGGGLKSQLDKDPAHTPSIQNYGKPVSGLRGGGSSPQQPTPAGGSPGGATPGNAPCTPKLETGAC